MTSLTTIFGPGGFNATLYPPEKIFDRYAAIAEFTAELRSAGFLTKGYAIVDGQIHRAKHKDDKSGTKNAWYVLYENHNFISGCYGHWKDPYSRTTWTSFNDAEASYQQRQDYAAIMEQARLEQEAERIRVQDENAVLCVEEYAGYQDAKDNHPYLVTKKVARVPGIKWDGLIDLVIPMINENGEIRNLQRINFDGKKMFTPGCQVKGCFFVIHGSQSLILTAEGLSTGISLYMASGATVYVAFNAGNMPDVTKIARRQHPDAKLIVCADNDRFSKNAKGEPMNTGRIAAEKAVKEAGPGTMMVLPHFPDSDTDSTDFNDLQVRYGAEKVKAYVMNNPSTENSIFPTKPLYGALKAHPFIDAKSLIEVYEPPEPIVKGFMYHDYYGAIIAPPGAFKSFISLHIAYCVTNGFEWAGRKTNSKPVVLLVGEGFGGLKPRLKALEIAYGVPPSKKLIVSKLPADLRDLEKTSEVVHGIFEQCQALGELPSLVIVDTLHRNTSGDENSSSDFGQLLKNIDEQFRAAIPGIAFLFIHHTGHEDNGRARGTSAIRASLDIEWVAIRKDDVVSLKCTKFKDGAEPPNISFKAVSVETGWVDEDGEPVTSLYLEHTGDETASEPKAKKRKLSAREAAILTALDRAIAEHGIKPPAELRARFGGFEGNIGQTRKVVQIDHWRDQAYPVIDSDSNKRRSFQKIRDKLIELGIVQQFEDFWWRIDW